MRSKKITTGKTSFTAPVDFLFVPLVARDSDNQRPKLNAHLVGLHFRRVYISAELTVYAE